VSATAPPSSTCACVQETRAGALLVRVAAPPAGGEANDAVRRLLAKACRVAPSRVAIVRGGRGRDKVVRLEGVSAQEAATALDR
jgi:uncharacterized protein